MSAQRCQFIGGPMDGEQIHVPAPTLEYKCIEADPGPTTLDHEPWRFIPRRHSTYIRTRPHVFIHESEA